MTLTRSEAWSVMTWMLPTTTTMRRLSLALTLMRVLWQSEAAAHNSYWLHWQLYQQGHQWQEASLTASLWLCLILTTMRRSTKDWSNSPPSSCCLVTTEAMTTPSWERTQNKSSPKLKNHYCVNYKDYDGATSATSPVTSVERMTTGTAKSMAVSSLLQGVAS